VARARRSPELSLATIRERLVHSGLAWPIAAGLEALGAGEGFPEVADVDAALAPRAGVRFVEQAPRGRRGRPRPLHDLYDAVIIERGEVPTRPGSLHDLMNALVFARFPRAKRAVHARQRRLVAARFDERGERAVPHRSKEQDAIAMIDEGGVALLCASAVVSEARAASEERGEDRLRELAREGAILGVVFGHALYEHVAAEGPRVWAKAILVEAADPRRTSLEAVDAALAELVEQAGPEDLVRDRGSVPLAASVLGSREREP